jgi:hypothetical protein
MNSYNLLLSVDAVRFVTKKISFYTVYQWDKPSPSKVHNVYPKGSF